MMDSRTKGTESLTGKRAESSVHGLVCLECGAELYTDFISENQSGKLWLRCGKCGDFIDSGIMSDAPVDKFARRSFWLGISSILLLFLTGLPAIYYGIRSMLRARHTSVRREDRRAAIIGTSMGTVFGVMVGGCVATVSITALVAYLSFTQSSNAELSKNILKQLMSVDLPEEFQYGRAQYVMGMSIFRFRDAEKRDECSKYARFTFLPPVMIGATSTLKIQLAEDRLNRKAEYERTSSDDLGWPIANQESNLSRYVYKETVTDEDGNKTVNEVHQFVGFSVVSEGIFGVGLTIRQPSEIFPDEESVKAFITSIQAAEDLDLRAAWDTVRYAPADEESDSDEE